MTGKKPPPKTTGETTDKGERKAAKQVAATRAKLQKAMQDPEFRARVVQQLKGMLRDA